MAKLKKTNKLKKPTTRSKAKSLKPDSIAHKSKPKKASSAKRDIKNKAAKKLSRMGLKRWNSLSEEHQKQYLKDHPKSKYNKIGVKHDTDHTTKTEEPTKTDSSTPVSDSSTTTTETPTTEHGTKTATTESPSTEPHKPFHQRFREAFSRIKESTKESLHEGVKEGVEKALDKAIQEPLKPEAVKERIEKYKKDPPAHPRDGHDALAATIGTAFAIAAFGALAVLAPGAAIIVGLQLIDHSPDLIRAISEHKERRQGQNRNRDFEDEDKEYNRRRHEPEDTADIIGDTVQQHVNNLDPLDKDYFKKRIEDLQDQDSDAFKRQEKKWAGDPNWKKRNPLKDIDENAETPSPAPEEDSNKEEDATEDEEEDTDEDEEEVEPEPTPRRQSRTRSSRVQSLLLNTVEASFEGIDVRSPKELAVQLIAKEVVDDRKIKTTTLSDQGRGTYAALKLHPSSARLLHKWAKDQGIEKPFDPSYMHVTTCYSKKAIDYTPLSFVHGGREITPKNLEFLGRDEDASNNEKTLVLLLDRGFPNRRFYYAKEQGASHDFPDYKPHVSIAPPGHGVENLNNIDISKITFPLLVDYEYSDVLSILARVQQEGVAVSRSNPVEAKRFTRSGSLKNKAGHVLHYKQGDVKLTDASGDTWSVKASIFKERYRRLDDGRFDKSVKNKVHYKINRDEIITVKTLEGPVEAAVGDYILTNTSTGKSWPLKPDSFKKLYTIIVDKN